MPAGEIFRTLTPAYPRPAGWALPEAHDSPSTLAETIRVALGASMSAGLADGPSAEVAFFGSGIGCVLLGVVDKGVVRVRWKDGHGNQGGNDFTLARVDADDLADIVREAVERISSTTLEAAQL